MLHSSGQRQEPENELLDACIEELVIIANVPLAFEEKTGYSARFVNLVDFLLSLAGKTGKLKLVVPVRRDSRDAVPVFLPENVVIVPLSYYHRPLDFVRKAHSVLASLIRICFSATMKAPSAIGIVAPGALAAVAAPLLYYLRSKSLFFIMRGNKRKSMAYALGKRQMWRTIGGVAVTVFDGITRHLLRRDRVIMFAVGGLDRELQHDYAGVENRVFPITPLVPKELLHFKNDFQEDVENVLFVGRLMAEKGVGNLIAAFAEVRLRPASSLRLHIVGSGPEEGALRRQASQLGVESAVLFHGFVPRGTELWRLYDKSQIFVSPSFTEGFPRTIAEAMARGLAVLSTDVGGIGSRVKHEQNGLLVEPGNVKALSAQMLRLILDSELRASLVRRARQTVETMTFEHEGDRMICLIQEHLIRR